MVDYIKRLIKGKSDKVQEAAPTPGRLIEQSTRQESPAHPPDAITPITKRVLMILNDPPVASEGNQRLTQIFSWKNSETLAAEFIADIRKVSGGYLNYEIVDRIQDDEFPVKEDGFTYTPEGYVTAFRERKTHDPDRIDYKAQISKHNLEHRKRMGEFDEVWFFAFPFAGHYESTMVGPGSFWCNSPPVSETDRFPSRFVMMGFSYERGVGEMLESFGHRVESIMDQVYKQAGRSPNMWKRFIQHEKTNPGQSNVGTVHFAPNSERDYDWGNKTPVTSYCDDWLTYPTLPGNARTVTCADWGDGDIRKHHIWWLDHLPKVPGETDGVTNNWWEYIALQRTDF
ncbi:MAG: hypothetical protein IT335_00445 [Thermomicrobiales bacterium]|jgi:hypothetical protein|nr:hypothetical protein [Thermomicrobiales bacterium]